MEAGFFTLWATREATRILELRPSLGLSLLFLNPVFLLKPLSLPFHSLSFHFIYGFLCYAKACKFYYIPFVYLEILETNPLSVASFENIFCQSQDCLLILFMVSFAVQKLLSLIRYHLFIFVFISIILGD